MGAAVTPHTQVYTGDAAAVLGLLPAETIQTCITSPPYYGLRDYGADGQIGNEESPAAYVGRLVGVFRAVRRVLVPGGTLWLNLGDSYARSPKKGRHKAGQNGKHERAVRSGGGRACSFTGAGCKEGDLLGIPWMVATALRDDGWHLRSEVIWHKTNPMTESAHDRLTRAHEQVFLLAKSRAYYFDDVAIMEPTTDGKGTRQKRDVWTVGTANYKGAHFAVYPEKLIEPMIEASTSPNGECDGCGKPLARIVRRHRIPTRPGLMTKIASQGGLVTGNRDPGRHVTTVETIGFDSGCGCMAGTRPSCVLDPFLGSGTTAVVANRLGRNCVGIELNPKYAEMAVERIANAARPDGGGKGRPRHRKGGANRQVGLGASGRD